MELTARNVTNVIEDCFCGKGNESNQSSVEVEGIINKFIFDRNKLESHRGDIMNMLSYLPEQFFEGSGDGYSFLGACMDKNGMQWGEHRQMEALFSLGMALDLVICLLPREVWKVLPGGVPYYMVRKSVLNHQ